MRKLSILTIALCIGICSVVRAQKINSELENRIDGIFQAWNKNYVPGGVVGIVEGGELIFSKAYGMASLEYDIPNEVSTVFNIASVSKQFTAFAILLLEQQGKLSLDDEVRKYLYEVPDFGHPITIRHLLNHTSGLRNFQNLLALAGWRRGEPMTNEDLLRYLNKQKELNFLPGAEYLYCNTGFNIVTTIVERLTGETFEDWTKANIFEPLGMKNSGYRRDMEAVHKFTATSYEGDEAEGFTQPLKFWTYLGNGNIYTTIEDLTKWLNNFREPKLGGQDLIDKLTEKGQLNDGSFLSYGLGIGVGTYRGLMTYRHGGSIGGYRSNMVYFPEQELGIILLSNFSSAAPTDKVKAIADLLLEGAFTETLPQPKPDQPISRTKVDYDIAQFQPYVGEYYVGEGQSIVLSSKEGRMYVYATGLLPAPLELLASSEQTFFVENIPIDVRLTETADGVSYRVRLEFEGKKLDGFKVADLDAYKDLPGRYYSPELDTYYTLKQEGDYFVVQHARHLDFRLIPHGKDQLLGTNYFFRTVKLVRGKANKIKGIRVSNGRVRNLLFEKV